MEGTDTHETRTVRVLRHNFRLSESLSDTLSKLVKNKDYDIKVFGTKQFALEGAEYYGSKYDTVLREAAKAFSEQDVSISLNESLRYKKMAGDVVRIAFRPSLVHRFLFDTMLDDAQTRVEEFSEQHQDLQGVVAASSQSNYLYADIPGNQLVEEPGHFSSVQDAFRDSIKSTSEKRLQYVQSLDIVGYDTEARLPVLKTKRNLI